MKDLIFLGNHENLTLISGIFYNNIVKGKFLFELKFIENIDAIFFHIESNTNLKIVSLIFKKNQAIDNSKYLNFH